VLGETVDIQLGKDDGSNDGQLDGSIDGDIVGIRLSLLDGFLVLGGKERYIIVGHDEVDDTVGFSIVEEDSDEDPVE
jgi:hypothetical protein